MVNDESPNLLTTVIGKLKQKSMTNLSVSVFWCPNCFILGYDLQNYYLQFSFMRILNFTGSKTQGTELDSKVSGTLMSCIFHSYFHAFVVMPFHFELFHFEND